MRRLSAHKLLACADEVIDVKRRDFIRLGCHGGRTSSPTRAGSTEAQVIALERAKTEKEAHGGFASEHPGYCGAQDTFYVGNLKGVGRVYQQTFIDTYAKVACAKLYDRKTSITGRVACGRDCVDHLS